MQKIKILRQPLLGETVHFGFCPAKIGFFRGLGGGPWNFFSLESSYFCDLGSHAKKIRGVPKKFFALESSYFGDLEAHAKF